MSHLVETLAYNKAETPWHGLGIPVDDDLTPQRMLEVAGLNWSVRKEPLLTKDGVLAHDKFGLIRSSDNAYLSTVGHAYKPVQNADSLEFFSEFCTNGSMKMETAGSLDNGRYVFALASIQESFNLGKTEDKVDGYLLFSSPHICGKSLNIMFTPIRVVCNNTLTAALRSANGRGNFKLHHSQKFDPETAKMALGLAKGQMSEFKAEAEFLSNIRTNQDSLREYFSTLWPTNTKASPSANDNRELSNTAEAAMDIFRNQPGADFFPESWWNAFNAVTYITDHIAGRTPNNRLRRAWFGGGQKLKQDALNLAIEFARKAA